MAIGSDTYAYRRDLPHLQKSEKTYFVTFRTHRHFVLPPKARDIVLEVVTRDHEVTYWLHCAVVMPDHVHLLIATLDAWPLARVTHRLKGVSAHLINRHCGRRGHVWQHESFDRILRSDESARKVAEYISQNPVRKALVATADEYRWLWRNGVAPPPRRRL
jgi:putative transposase